MRNYIHINLCVSLILAQLMFVSGVTPHGGGGVVDPGCRTVAILMHYLFLVSFMWMLMEGVVLYVALVKVFVKNQKRYIMGFTIFSMVSSLFNASYSQCSCVHRLYMQHQFLCLQVPLCCTWVSVFPWALLCTLRQTMAMAMYKSLTALKTMTPPPNRPLCKFAYRRGYNYNLQD